MPTNYNTSKYWIEGSDLLTEAEKIQIAKDLRELEREGVIRFRNDRWELGTGAEVEEVPDGQVARIRSDEEGTK